MLKKQICQICGLIVFTGSASATGYYAWKNDIFKKSKKDNFDNKSNLSEKTPSETSEKVVDINLQQSQPEQKNEEKQIILNDLNTNVFYEFVVDNTCSNDCFNSGTKGYELYIENDQNQEQIFSVVSIYSGTSLNDLKKHGKSIFIKNTKYFVEITEEISDNLNVLKAKSLAIRFNSNIITWIDLNSFKKNYK